MHQQSNQLRHSLLYGAITGGIILVFLLAIFIFGMANNSKLISISGVIFIAGGYISVKRFRDISEGGLLSYGKAYGTAFLTFLFAGIVWAIYGYILYKHLAPGLLEEKLLESQDALLQFGWSEEMIESMTTVNKPTAVGIAFGYIFYSALAGSILALIIAAILKRQENPLLKNDE